ncbi:unnamed protein product [Symbiodinium sp. CCMP2592]|nr:unnamed protein product [Symbiodinium sp. CCMP2592]
MPPFLEQGGFERPLKHLDLPETPSTAVPSVTPSPLGSPVVGESPKLCGGEKALDVHRPEISTCRGREQPTGDAWLEGNGVATLDLGGDAGLLIGGLLAGPRPRPLGLVKPERTVVAEAWLLRAALSVATAKMAGQVLASFAPSQITLLRATGVVARAKPAVSAAQQVAWSALARCSHTRSQRRRLLHGALLAAAGEFGLKQPAQMADVISDWCATQEIAGLPLLVTGKDARVIPALLLSVLSRLQGRQPRIDPKGLAVAELCAASVLEHITLPSPRKGIFKVPDLTKLSPSALVNCRLLIRDVSQASPGFRFALKGQVTAQVTELHETAPQTAGIPVLAPAARRAKAAIFVEDVSLPLRAEVPLAAEALFGPGLQAREAFAWQVPQQILFAKLRTRLKSFRGASDSERSQRNAPGALVPWP